MTKASELLGVSENASESEIKQAHRKAVQANHPDRGGSEEITCALNKARDEMLGDTTKPDETLALISSLFTSIVFSNKKGDLTALCIDEVNHRIQLHNGQINNLHSESLRWDTQRVVYKGSRVNMYESIVQSRIDNINREISKLHKEIDTFSKVIEELKNYTDTAPEQDSVWQVNKWV